MVVIRHVVELIINPFFVALFLLGLCTWFMWRRTYETFVRIGLLTSFIILILISTGWLPQFLSSKLESQYPVVTQIDPKIQWIVVLSGGQSEEEGMPANNLLTSASIKRLVEGVRLFRALPNAKFLVTGGADKPEEPEAKKLAQLAEWFAVPRQQIVLEQNSLNTADQAKEIKQIVNEQPFYLVTSANHMSRSMALCRAQGLHPIAAPTDFIFGGIDSLSERAIIPNAYNLILFTLTMHELLGRVWATIIKDI